MVKRSTTIRDRHRTVIARGQPACALCGMPIDYTLGWETGTDGRKRPNPMMFVVDHIIALDAGGTDTLDNKQPAHWRCNREKSNKRHGQTVRAVPGINW